MKLSDGVLDTEVSFELKGICEIDLSHISKCFGKSIISRWHEEYRLVNIRAKVKVNISKNDALALIEMLNLVESNSTVFNNASSWSAR